MANEVFVDITGYEGLYQISSNGIVKRLKSIVHYSDGRTYKYPERILKQGTTKQGYKVVNLSKNSVVSSFFVHRLVCSHFVQNPECKKYVNHLNGITNDNRVENLAWCTQSENVLHAYTLGYKISEETRNKMSDARKGIKFSESHRKKLSEMQMGEKSHRSVPVIDTITGIEYVSIKDYSLKNGLNYHTTKGKWRKNKLKHIRKTVKA